MLDNRLPNISNSSNKYIKWTNISADNAFKKAWNSKVCRFRVKCSLHFAAKESLFPSRIPVAEGETWSVKDFFLLIGRCNPCKIPV